MYLQCACSATKPTFPAITADSQESPRAPSCAPVLDFAALPRVIARANSIVHPVLFALFGIADFLAYLWRARCIDKLKAVIFAIGDFLFHSVALRFAPFSVPLSGNGIAALAALNAKVFKPVPEIAVTDTDLFGNLLDAQSLNAVKVKQEGKNRLSKLHFNFALSSAHPVFGKTFSGTCDSPSPVRLRNLKSLAALLASYGYALARIGRILSEMLALPSVLAFESAKSTFGRCFPLEGCAADFADKCGGHKSTPYQRDQLLVEGKRSPIGGDNNNIRLCATGQPFTLDAVIIP